MGFSHILLPVDFSGRSAAIAPAVAALARHDGARVTLLHALEGEKYRGRLDEFVPDLWERIQVTRAEQEGKPAQVIVDHAAASGADLIMMPTLGYSTFRALLLGSVASLVLHDATCPVWTARHADPVTAPVTYENVVCAIDLAAACVPVLAFAREFADGWGARLHVVHSVPAVDERFYSAAAERAHRYLCDQARRDYPDIATAAGVEQPLEVLEGHGVARSINEAAAARQADVLIIGRGAIQGVLGRLRNNAHELIRTAPCPVLSV